MGPGFRRDDVEYLGNHHAAIDDDGLAGDEGAGLGGEQQRGAGDVFGLAEAAENRSTLTIEKVLLFCYHYDPVQNKYVLFATNFMKAGGALTVLILGWFLIHMFRLERARKERLA